MSCKVLSKEKISDKEFLTLDFDFNDSLIILTNNKYERVCKRYSKPNCKTLG